MRSFYRPFILTCAITTLFFAPIHLTGCGKVSSSADPESGGGAGNSSSDGGGTATGASPSEEPDEETLRACRKTSQCTLVPSSCCQPCDEPSASNYEAVVRGYEEAFRAVACPKDTACPACETPFTPHLFAACVAGTCRAVDLKEDPASSCETDSDCTLLPPRCCPRISPNDPPPHAIAINESRAEDFFVSLCAGVNDDGPPCEWQAPAGLNAICIENRCVVAGE